MPATLVLLSCTIPAEMVVMIERGPRLSQKIFIYWYLLDDYLDMQGVITVSCYF